MAIMSYLKTCSFITTVWSYYAASGFTLHLHRPLRHASIQRSGLGKLPMTTAGELPTALEWLAQERDGDIKGPISSLRWFDPEEMSTTTEKSSAEWKRMPLYPLDACYLPSKTKHFIINIQAKNIKMMQVCSITVGQMP